VRDERLHGLANNSRSACVRKAEEKRPITGLATAIEDLHCRVLHRQIPFAMPQDRPIMTQGMRSSMAQDNTPVAYRIRFEKDDASVKVTYDLSVPMDGPALIASFQVSVEGADLIGNFIPGQSRFNGAQFHTLSRPDQDAAVSFSISSNEGWTASGSDVLRGSKAHDDAEFSN
jgi:hypothetical protein